MASNIFDAFNVEYIDFETFLRFAICEPKMTVHVNEFVVQVKYIEFVQYISDNCYCL